MTQKRVLIGSMAAAHWFTDFRTPRDFDYLVNDKSQFEPIDGIEYFNAKGAGLQLIYEYNEEIAHPSNLYTLKVSHSFWDSHLWNKTIHDVIFFQYHNVDYNPYLGKLLYDDWVTIHGTKKVNLRKSNEEFFVDSVNRQIPHDSIHKAVAYYEEPLYNYIKNDKSSAWTSKELFDNLTEEKKLRLCWEEIYVVALERFLIPQNFKCSKAHAYREAIRLLVTSMSKGFFPLYIMLNLSKLIKPEIDYITKFRENIYDYSRA